MSRVWHLITGEYPPNCGGVGDYTAHIAQAMTDAGREVHIWTMGESGTAIESGIHVHRVAGGFGPLGLRSINRGLQQFDRPRRIVVQYTHSNCGYRGLNFPFGIWVWLRRRWHGDRVDTMFHEVWFPWVRRPIKHNLIAAVSRITGAFLTRASTICYVSIEAWGPFVRALHRRARIEWSPIPANIASPVADSDIAAYRATLPGGPIIAHFGTYSALITDLLSPAIGRIVARSTASILLIGDGSENYRAQLIRQHPELASRVIATGRMPAAHVAVAIHAADLVLQPYPDGISTRRTSVMGALAMGVPIVSNRGRLSDSIWADSGLVLADSPDPVLLADLAIEMLSHPDRRRTVAALGPVLYDRFCSVRHTITRLLNTESPDAGH
jgi:glycosyltransferase involved in cell wall biosynthesis